MATATVHRRGRLQREHAPTLYTQAWYPDAGRQPKALIVLVHDFHSHSGWLKRTCRALAGTGYAVYAYDQRGHGRSEGSRSYFDRFDDVLADLFAFTQHVRARRKARRKPSLPLYLLGASLGAVICLHAVAKAPDAFAGLLLVAPTLESPGTAGLAASAMATLAPRSRSAEPRHSRSVSRERRVQHAYTKDRYVDRGRVRARPAAEFAAALASLQSACDRVSVPVLVFAGARSRSKQQQRVCDLLERLSSQDTAHVTLPRGRTEVLRERCKDLAHAHMVTWLDERL